MQEPQNPYNSLSPQISRGIKPGPESTSESGVNTWRKADSTPQESKPEEVRTILRTGDTANGLKMLLLEHKSHEFDNQASQPTLVELEPQYLRYVRHHLRRDEPTPRAKLHRVDRGLSIDQNQNWEPVAGNSSDEKILISSSEKAAKINSMAFSMVDPGRRVVMSDRYRLRRLS